MFRVPGSRFVFWFGFVVLGFTVPVFTVPMFPGPLFARAAQDIELIDPATRVAAYVEQYYSRAQSIVTEETVTLQPLDHSLTALGFPRTLVYELRVEWDPDAPPDKRATVVRELVRARGPALGPPKQPDCLDPKSVSPEPLAFLLPEQRRKFSYRMGKSDRVDGRDAVMLEFKPLVQEKPRVDWNGDCAQIELTGRTVARVWADAATSEILKYEERLIGMTDIPAPRERGRSPFLPMWYTVERADTSIRYRPVRFEDPEETVLLPSEIISITVIRDSGMPQLRTTQRFANYRRYVTGGRLVVE
jgi:hypothetical protein